MNRNQFSSVCAGVAWALMAQCVLAQSFPSKPVRLINQFAPGSSGDTTLRVIAPIMNQDLGQPVVIDNRAGGGGVVAAELAMRAAPDGHTILATFPATFVQPCAISIGLACL